MTSRDAFAPFPRGMSLLGSRALEERGRCVEPTQRNQEYSHQQSCRHARAGSAALSFEKPPDPLCARMIDNFDALNGQEVTVAGRLMSWRKQGGLAFGHVQDQSGRIQFFLRKQAVKPKEAGLGNLGFAESNLLDLGDIVEATGKVARTERGEISVFVETLRILTKAIRPLPDQWHGLEGSRTDSAQALSGHDSRAGKPNVRARSAKWSRRSRRF